MCGDRPFLVIYGFIMSCKKYNKVCTVVCRNELCTHSLQINEGRWGELLVLTLASLSLPNYFVVYIFDTDGFAMSNRSYDMYIIAICCESVFSVITLPNTIKLDNTKLMDEWKTIRNAFTSRTRVALSSHLVFL